MAKDEVEPSCPCWHFMAVLQMIKVKAVFLNLEKDKNKTDTTTTKKDQ